MKEFIEYIAKNLVDKSDDVVVQEEIRNDTTVYLLKVADDDIGKIIGKNGNTVAALRLLTVAVNKKAGKKAKLKIVEKNQAPSASSSAPANP
jgi:predicted RNA-binding protein YlqC (UPF0109 family)